MRLSAFDRELMKVVDAQAAVIRNLPPQVRTSEVEPLIAEADKAHKALKAVLA